MTIIHMQTDEVRHLIQKMVWSYQNVRESLQEVKNSCQKMEWEGSDSVRFRMKVNILNNNFDHVQDEYVSLAEKTLLEIQQWEEADSRSNIRNPEIEPGKRTIGSLIGGISARKALNEMWKEMTTDEKVAFLEDYQRMLSEKYGLPVFPIKIDDINAQGQYSQGVITIDKDNFGSLLYDDPSFLLNTIAHETRHGMQEYYIMFPDQCPDIISKEELKSWQENWQDYISSNDDFWGYRKQPIEKDAREFARREVDDYLTEYSSGFISGHSGGGAGGSGVGGW